MVAGDRLLWALFNAFPHRLAAAIRICLQILVPNEVTSVMYQEDILGYNIERKGFITAERRSLQALNRVCDGRAKVITGSSIVSFGFFGSVMAGAQIITGLVWVYSGPNDHYGLKRDL